MPGDASGVLTAGTFVAARERQLFLVEHRSRDTRTEDAVLIVPPFAEEMNRCRRMFTLLGQRLASMGTATLVLDLSGTGESAGDFGDVTWETWREDLRVTLEHASAIGYRRVSICGVRLGALLALDSIARDGTRVDGPVLLWQPVLDGSAFLTQFLRLRLASGLRSSAQPQETTRSLRARLGSGESIEVAGYRINPALVAAVDPLRLASLAQRAAVPLSWFEISSASDASSPAVSIGNELRSVGMQVDYEHCAGEPFWSLAEITTVPALIEATCACLQRYQRSHIHDVRSTAHN